MKAKPREFWIEIWDEQPDDDLIHHRPVANHYFAPCSKADELIHVVEYSALVAAQEEIMKLKSDLEAT